jgi:hypothetical protein
MQHIVRVETLDVSLPGCFDLYRPPGPWQLKLCLRAAFSRLAQVFGLQEKILQNRLPLKKKRKY